MLNKRQFSKCIMKATMNNYNPKTYSDRHPVNCRFRGVFFFPPVTKGYLEIDKIIKPTHRRFRVVRFIFENRSSKVPPCEN